MMQDRLWDGPCGRGAAASGSMPMAHAGRGPQALRTFAVAAILGIGTVVAETGPAMADLMINPHDGMQDIINDPGGTTATGDPNNQPPQGNGLPFGLTGYNSQTSGQGPSLVAVAAGNYTFTYMGSGNAVSIDTFKVTDSLGNACTFTNNGGGGGGSAPGTACTLFFDAGTDIQFTYTNTNTGAMVSDDTNPSPTTISYFLGLDSSSHCMGSPPGTPSCDNLGDALTGPSFADAYIGLSDLPWQPTLDHDFQDLGVRVDELSVPAPEPASAALLAAALLGLIGFQRKRKRAEPHGP